MRWRTHKLGCGFRIKHGFAFKSEFFTDEGKYIVLTPGNFHEAGGFRLRPGKDRYYSITPPSDFVLEQEDLIVAMTEQGPGLLGSSALIPETDTFLHNQRLGLVQDLDPEVFNRKFLYYLFNTYSVRGQIAASASGVKVRHTSPERIYAVDVTVPEVPIQREIADILSAYDDLIGNNRRRMELLEESARLLFKEWFVHLRFPGHEHTNIVDGVPEGWERKAAIDAMQVLSGGTPKTSVPDYWDGEIPFFTPKDATENAYVLDTEKHLTDQGLNACNSKVYQKDTLFITARGTVGKLNLAQVPMAMNQSCYALMAREPLTQHFLYFAMQQAIAHIKAKAGGAVFNAIVVDTFKLIPFLVPDEQLILAFLELASPVLEQIDNLIRQNQQLAQARDILLPRLMNGEVAV